MPGAEVLAVPATAPAASLATPASLRADSSAVELIALDPRKRQKFKLASKEVNIFPCKHLGTRQPMTTLVCSDGIIRGNS